MNTQLQEMFSKSTFSILDKKYIYAKVSKEPSTKNHFMVSSDSDELTVITEDTREQELDIIEKNQNLWRLVSLNLNIPFMAGTLATINSACAEEGLNNLIVSTYSKDYVIVKDTQVEQIKLVLQKLGFSEDNNKK